MRIGDVIVVSGSSFISKTIKSIVGSKWTHAAVYVGNGNILEIDWNSRARIVKNHYFNGELEYVVMRSKEPITKEQRHKLIAAAVAHDNTGNRYDFPLLVSIYMKKRFPNVKLFSSWNMKNHFICSELIENVMKAAGIDWFPNTEGDICPHDYIESPHLKEVPAIDGYELVRKTSKWGRMPILENMNVKATV